MANELSTEPGQPRLLARVAERNLGTCSKRMRKAFKCLLVVTCSVILSTAMAGCSSIGLRSAVSMKMSRAKNAPRDASVYIDEEFIGPLYYVAAHGVRLPTGKHRITVTRDGYFPWDRMVDADRQPISLNVELTPIPD